MVPRCRAAGSRMSVPAAAPCAWREDAAHVGVTGQRPPAARGCRLDGNDEGLIELAKKNALAIGAGHSFIIFMKNAFPSGRGLVYIGWPARDAAVAALPAAGGCCTACGMVAALLRARACLRLRTAHGLSAQALPRMLFPHELLLQSMCSRRCRAAPPCAASTAPPPTPRRLWSARMAASGAASWVGAGKVDFLAWAGRAVWQGRVAWVWGVGPAEGSVHGRPGLFHALRPGPRPLGPPACLPLQACWTASARWGWRTTRVSGQEPGNRGAGGLRLWRMPGAPSAGPGAACTHGWAGAHSACRCPGAEEPAQDDWLQAVTSLLAGAFGSRQLHGAMCSNHALACGWSGNAACPSHSPPSIILTC